MRLRHGPRPPAIRAFAVLFLLQAATAFWHQMSDLAATQAILASSVPQLGVDRDLTIIVTSARLTIAIIPVALIWFLASRFARILVLALVAVRLLTLPHALSGEPLAPAWAASLLLAVAAAAILLSPGAACWFRKPLKPAP